MIKLTLLVLVGVAVCTGEKEGIVCPEGITTFAYTQDNTHYWFCPEVGARALLRECRDGSVYDRRSGICSMRLEGRLSKRGAAQDKDECEQGFYRLNINGTDKCVACEHKCDPEGSEMPYCDMFGQCRCKAGYGIINPRTCQGFKCRPGMDYLGGVCVHKTRYAKFGRGITGFIGAGGLLLAYNAQGLLGTVCDDGFDNSTANVVCQKLGYERFVFWTYNNFAYVPSGTEFKTKRGNTFSYREASPILLNYLSCSSASEDCQYTIIDQNNKPCSHPEDIILECYEEETIQFQLSESGILLAKVDTAATEVTGTVCVDDTLTKSTGTFLCNQLGFGSYEKSVRKSTIGSDLGSLPIVLDELNCPEGSTSVSQCTYHSLVHNCDHSDDIYIHCVDPKSVTFKIEESGLLVSSVRTTLGKQTGAVCDDGFDDETANFVCKTLGYNSVETYKSNEGYSHWSEAELAIVMDDLKCPAGARSMKDCDFVTYEENCGMGEELVFVCAESRNLTFYQNKTVHVRITGEISGVREGQLCGKNITEHEANYICREMGFERMAKTEEVHLENANIVMQDLTCNTELECSYEPLAKDCDVALRIYCFEEQIAEFELGTQGLLLAKLQLNELDGGVPVHGTVCDDEFNDVTADVVCKSMGYEGAESWKYDSTAGLGGKYPIVLDNFVCQTKEVALKDCRFHVDPNCGHGEDVVLNCKNSARIQTE